MVRKVEQGVVESGVEMESGLDIGKWTVESRVEWKERF